MAAMDRTAGDGTSTEQVRAWRAVLLAERIAAVAQLTALTRDFGTLVAASIDVATDDEHDPEGATIAFERAQVAALRTRAEDRLAELDAALTSLTDGTYGVCEHCGAPIAAERLAVRPAARRCVSCAASER